jgi:hypothetical protein
MNVPAMASDTSSTLGPYPGGEICCQSCTVPAIKFSLIQGKPAAGSLGRGKAQGMGRPRRAARQGVGGEGSRPGGPAAPGPAGGGGGRAGARARECWRAARAYAPTTSMLPCADAEMRNLTPISGNLVSAK